MSALVDAVRSAHRTRLYARLRRAERASTGGEIRRALILWALPAAAPALAVLAVVLGRERRLLEVGAALVLTLLVAHLVGKPRLQAFDLLHQPSRRGLVLGHALHRVPVWLWCGGLVAATWLVRVPTLRERVDGVALLVAAVFAPLAIGLSSGAERVATRAGRDEVASLLPLLFPVLGWQAAELWFDHGAWDWALPLLGAVIGIVSVVRAGAVAATIRKALAVILAAAVSLPVAMSPGELLAPDVWAIPLLGTGCVVLCVVVIAMSVRTQIACVELAEVVRTRSDEPPRGRGAARVAHDAPGRTRSSTGYSDRLLAGNGLWRARLQYARDQWLPEETIGVDALGGWAGTGSILLLTVFRGPILAATAVALAGRSGVPVWLAILAGCLASRAVAVDTLDLQPRLWLLGVDYREQVLQGLRALLLFAVLPTLCTAVAALAIAGPQDPARWAAVLVVAATLLLRAGAPGLWPLQETHRLRLVWLWGAVMALAIAYEAWWTPHDATVAAGAVAALGVVLLVVRILRLREPHLRDCVRRSAEP